MRRAHRRWPLGWTRRPDVVGSMRQIGTSPSLLGLVPMLVIAAPLTPIPVALSLLLVWCFCIETRGRDLRDLERRPVPAHRISGRASARRYNPALCNPARAPCPII